MVCIDVNFFPDKKRGIRCSSARIPPQCRDDTVCCVSATAAAAAAGWLWMGGQPECNDEMEKFQRSEHSHAEGNWRSRHQRTPHDMLSIRRRRQRERTTKFDYVWLLTKRQLQRYRNEILFRRLQGGKMERWRRRRQRPGEFF